MPPAKAGGRAPRRESRHLPAKAGEAEPPRAVRRKTQELTLLRAISPALAGAETAKQRPGVCLRVTPRPAEQGRGSR
jgi:hypothetical protein